MELERFNLRLKKSLADENIAEGILDFQQRWREKRDGAIQTLEKDTGKSFAELAENLSAAKARARTSATALNDFIKNAQQAGSKVIQSPDAATACEDIVQILKDRNIKLVVKSKSMLTEEIFLNSYLERSGIMPVETDLGQWILQIGNEHPSHLVLPAVHKRRHQVAKLYEKILGRSFDPDDIETLAKVVRPELRKHFLQAGAGITGGNVLIAETGSVGIVTNEGNANLTSGLSSVHIAVVGVDKLVGELAEAIQLLRLLSKSGTGQLFTTYVSFLTGPRQGKEQFIVLVDNGRTKMSKDAEFAEAMGCIRCGACANVCPPYQAVGGHAFGYVYAGAIGLVNTSFHHSEKDASGPASLCVSCGACATVCPVNIPLPDQILTTRMRIGKKRHSLLANKKIQAMLFVWARPKLFRGAALLARRFSFLSRLLPAKYRLNQLGIKPQPSAKIQISKMLTGKAGKEGQTGKESQKGRKQKDNAQIAQEPDAQDSSDGELNRGKIYQTQATGKKVVFFMQCISDQLTPEIAVATARLIAATGAEIVLPPRQHCCGLPALDAGNHKLAKKMAAQTFKSLKDSGKPSSGKPPKGTPEKEAKPEKEADIIVTTAGSCANMMAHEYKKLTGKKLEVLDIVEFLSGPGKLPDGALAEKGAQKTVVAHMFCQKSSAEVINRQAGTNGTVNKLQNNSNEPQNALNQLIFQLTGKAPQPLNEAEFCCGFGGFTSTANSGVSNVVLSRKISNLEVAKADIWVTDNPGCVLHLRKGASIHRNKIEVLHIAEYLARQI